MTGQKGDSHSAVWFCGFRTNIGFFFLNTEFDGLGAGGKGHRLDRSEAAQVN